jgi:hypothetical protein
MFPSTLSSFNYPTSSNKLNSPSHSALHNTVSSAVGQLEAVIGVTGDNSVLGTINGDLRSAASGGGGHVQTANLGGTGYAGGYTKGDVLIASASSVLTKLGVGSDNQVVTADASQATGVKWASPTLVGQVASVISIRGVSETSVLTSTIPASILGSGNVVESTMFVNKFAATGSVLVKATFGGAVLSSVMVVPTGTLASISGRINYTILANGNNNQRGILEVNLGQQKDPSAFGSVVSVRLYDMNTASVATASGKTMGVTMIMSNAGANDYVDVDGSYIKKIL